MNIWNQLLTEQQSRTIHQEDVAWSFHEGVFSAHKQLSTLFSASYDALIIRKNADWDLASPSNFIRQERKNFHLLVSDELDKEIQFYLINYWSLIMSIKLDNKDTPLVLVHMATSLDGKIATSNGHSKWIGNQENLMHAHRLRAIVGGILVGSYTVNSDQPKLNVRHVEGENPIRLILSNKTNCFKNLPKVEDSETYLLRHEKYKNSTPNYSFDKNIYFEGDDENTGLTNLLKQLKSFGIHSILIEGGPTTVSNFVKENLVTIFQLHFAPLLLGSGKAMVELPEIKTISEGLTMKNSYYTQMGDSMMITGSL